MYPIESIRFLAENVVEAEILAPRVAAHAKPGQFVILRVDEDGERVPFTICDYDRERGTVTLLVQTVGYTTMLFARMKAGQALADFVGPLGHPTDLAPYRNIMLVGGGIGTAVIYPQAKALCAEGKAADVIVGARNKSLVMYEDNFRKYAKNLYITTDDGSYGEKGFVTDVARRLLEQGSYDCVFAVGPLPMMRAVCKVTKEFGVKTIVSMNSMMVDGTGMCGCCRLTVGGETKYACVHGPEFDGHLVDFDEAINRSRFYVEQEKKHVCKLTGEVR